MTSTAFTELIGCSLPVQLAGMGGIGSNIELPAAVSEAGGLGMLGAAGLSSDALEDALTALATATSGPFGVNFLMPFIDPDAVIVASKRCHVVEFFYGDPDRSLVELVHAGGALAAWQVGSSQEANAALHAGCDFIVVQGIEAGGHVRGTQPLASVLAEVIATVPVPVVAAGGIGTARGVASALEAGASGVRIGTRFLATDESIAHPDYVDALIKASSSETVLTETFSKGWRAPHRVLRCAMEAAETSDAEFVATVEGDANGKIPRLATMPPTKNVRGNIAAMAMYAGTSVGGVTARRPAREVVLELCEEI